MSDIVKEALKLFERVQKLEEERDAALETLRLVRLDKSVNKFDVLMAEAKRDTANEMRLRMMEEMQKARRERDAALERIQQLEGQDWFTRAITAEAGVEVLSGRVRDLEWYLEQARQERDAALERVRVLEEARND